MNSWVAKDKIKDYPTELEDFPLLRGLYERVRDIPAVKATSRDQARYSSVKEWNTTAFIRISAQPRIRAHL